MRESSTEITRAFLQDLGFLVEDIPEAPPEKRADLRAILESDEYIIEVKAKGPHEVWPELLSDAERNGLATKTREVRPWGALASVIQDAQEQLIQTPCSPAAFRIFAGLAAHGDGHFVAECLAARLLGAVLFVPIDPMQLKIGTPKICYYHGHNDFTRYPNLDAALLGTHGGFRLLVNSLATRYEAFKESALYKAFDRQGSVVDPARDEQRGEALLLGGDFVDKRDGRAQARYIMKKYGLRGSVMAEYSFFGLAVPNRLNT